MIRTTSHFEVYFHPTARLSDAECKALHGVWSIELPPRVPGRRSYPRGGDRVVLEYAAGDALEKALGKLNHRRTSLSIDSYDHNGEVCWQAIFSKTRPCRIESSPLQVGRDSLQYWRVPFMFSDITFFWGTKSR